MPDEPSPALDSLYEALTEVQAHLHEHAQERESILQAVEKMEKELNDQRAAAAHAGERDTYNRLSEDLTKLTRAYRVASEDPDADPLDEYQWTDEDPKDQPQEADDAELRSGSRMGAAPDDRRGAGVAAESGDGPAPEAGSVDSDPGAPGRPVDRGSSSEGEQRVDEIAGGR